MTVNSEQNAATMKGGRSVRLLRLSQIIGPQGPLPVSKSTFWNKVRSGTFPQPIKISSRITCWREDEILSLLENLTNGSRDND